VTLGFGEIIRVILVNWTELSGGPNGISSIPRPSFFGLPFKPPGDDPTFASFFGLEYSPNQRIIFLYYLILALALLTNLFVSRMRKLPIGRAWEAMREDEIACKAMGINARNVKLSAFAIGAMLGGFAGVFFAARQGFISPESFTFNESAIILAIVVLGGMGSQLGVVLASLVLVLLPELGTRFRRVPDAALRRGDDPDHGLEAGRHPLAPRTDAALPRRRQAMSAASPLLSVERLTMRFGGLLAIDDLSLDVAARQITGVIGPNGAGKTTFFNCLTGFYKPTIGSIRLNHPQRGVMRLEELASHQVARTAQVVRTFQNIRLFPKMTVLENLIVAQHNALQHASRFSLAGSSACPAIAVPNRRRWTRRLAGSSA
jgi:ABC-type multidrug transport system fused ATPase/permease subunit